MLRFSAISPPIDQFCYLKFKILRRNWINLLTMKREITLAIQIILRNQRWILFFNTLKYLTIHHNFKFIKIATPDQITNEWSYLQYKFIFH